MKEFLSVLLVSLAFDASAQSVFSNEINSSLQAVLQDYPNKLKNVKGTLVAKKGQTSEYHSLVKVPGAVSASITESRNALTWKGTMFRGSDFSKASEKFSALYGLINKAIIKSVHEKPFILTGNYVEPSSTRPTSIRFDLLPSTGELKDVVVELNMYKSGRDYIIDLVVNSK